jgi:hypothetical protein
MSGTEPMTGKVRQMAMTVDMPFGRRLAVAVLLPLIGTVGLMTVAGCANDDPIVDGGPAASPAVPSSAPVSPGDSASTSTSAMADRITVEKTGGIAGVRETLVIEPDGAWTRTGRTGSSRTGRLTPEQLAQLRTLTGSADLRGESSQKTTDNNCADAFVYRLTVGSTTVVYSDCSSGSAPPVASQIVTLLATATK